MRYARGVLALLTIMTAMLMTGCYQGETIVGEVRPVESDDAVAYAVSGPWNFAGVLARPKDASEWRLAGAFEFPTSGYSVEVVVQPYDWRTDRMGLTFYVQKPTNSLAQLPITVIETVETTFSAPMNAEFKAFFREGKNNLPRCGVIIQ